MQRLIFAKNTMLNIIATKKNGKVNAVITADTVLPGAETLLVLGDYKALRKCFDI